MNEKTVKSGERILCVLTSPRGEGQPFGVSVYAVGADKPHRVLEATSPRSEISGFLKLMQESGRPSEQIARMLSPDSCTAAEM